MDAAPPGASSTRPGARHHPLRRGSYRVVNTGQPGTPAEDLASRLPSMVQTHRPQMVVLVGGLFWNWDRTGGRHKMLSVPYDLPLGLDRLRTLRLLRLLQEQPVTETPLRLKQLDPQIRRQLVQQLQSPEAMQDNRGVPMVPMAGCTDVPAKREQFYHLRRGSEGVIQILEDLLRDEPDCLGARISAAEIYIRLRRHRRARVHARQAPALRQNQPHAQVALSLARSALGERARDTWR